MEIPYAAAIGAPPRLEGKPAIYTHVRSGIAQMSNLTFTNVRKYPTLDPNVLWVEYHGEALISITGRHYQQDYVTRMETKDGKIVHLSLFCHSPERVIPNPCCISFDRKSLRLSYRSLNKASKLFETRLVAIAFNF